MKKNYIVLSCFLLGLSFSVGAQVSDHVPGDLLVMLQPNGSINKLIESQQQYARTGTELIMVRCVSPRMNIWQLHFNNQTIDEDRFLSALRNSDLVKIAQFNHYASLRSVPNDSLFPAQWNLNNTGQNGGTPGDDVDAENAWNITTGGLTADGDSIVIAIVDCGFDITHPDIDFWKDYSGTPGYPGDYNGWTGDTTGIINDSNCTPQGHGTHVAGIAGARGNNKHGITGANWNVKIMPVEYGYYGTEAEVVEAYTFVMVQRDRYNKGLGNGFVVATNSSFGVDQGQPSDYPLWCAMYDSLGSVGILNAAATTDYNYNVDVVGDIPTTCPSNYLVTVTNTNDHDTLDDCGYGQRSIDLGAPGTNIWSTLPVDSYGTLTGTSMASPHVAGAIGLMYSLDCPKFDSAFKSDPATTALLIKSFIMASVDVVPALANKTASGGRLNIYKALKLEADYFGCASLIPADIQTVESSVKLFTVYPNPATDELNVKMSVTDNSSVTISLTDILGQQALTKQYQPGHTGSQNLAIDISQLPQGVYFITARNENGVSVTTKVVKM